MVLNRNVLFCALLAFCGAMFWASSLMSTAQAGRDYPWGDPDALDPASSARHLNSFLGGGGGNDAELIELIKALVKDKSREQPTILAVQQPGQAAPAIVPVMQQQPAPVAAPAVAAPIPLEEGGLPALPVDQVALAAAQAASTGDGGIRIASSAPIALSNPIKIKAGTGQLNYGRAVGI